MPMRRIIRNLLFLLLVAWAVAGSAATPQATRVLFVGNSLTYVGNLPAVFASLAEANGKPVETAMIVKGGATLTRWLDSGAVQRALAARHYDYVVLQERGNDFACGFGPKACEDSRHALHALAGIVRKAGARPVLMGTYQIGAGASARLMAAESKAADDNDMPYLAVSQRLNQGREQFPHADWFAKAGHPGHDLVALEAVLLYRQLYGQAPQATALDVRAPMFVPGSRFAPPDPVSLPLLPEVPLAGGYGYSRRELANAIKLSGKP